MAGRASRSCDGRRLRWRRRRWPAGGECSVQQRGDEARATDRLDPICTGSSSCGWRWWCGSSGKTQAQDEALWTHETDPCPCRLRRSSGQPVEQALACVHCRCRRTRRLRLRLRLGTHDSPSSVSASATSPTVTATASARCSPAPALGFHASLRRAPLLPQDALDCGSCPSPHRAVPPSTAAALTPQHRTQCRQSPLTARSHSMRPPGAAPHSSHNNQGPPTRRGWRLIYKRLSCSEPFRAPPSAQLSIMRQSKPSGGLCSTG